MSLDLKIYDRDTFHFCDAFSLILQKLWIFWALWALLNTFTGMCTRGCKENDHLVTLISFSAACALSSARNKESRLGSPECNENCFHGAIVFSLAMLKNLTITPKKLFARKEFVYTVQVRFQLERPGLAPKQQQSDYSSWDALSG